MRNPDRDHRPLRRRRDARRPLHSSCPAAPSRSGGASRGSSAIRSCVRRLAAAGPEVARANSWDDDGRAPARALPRTCWPGMADLTVARAGSRLRRRGARARWTRFSTPHAAPGGIRTCSTCPTRLPSRELSVRPRPDRGVAGPAGEPRASRRACETHARRGSSRRSPCTAGGALSGRPYACWVATSLASENAGRRTGPAVLASTRAPRERAVARAVRASRARRARRRSSPPAPSSRADVARRVDSTRSRWASSRYRSTRHDFSPEPDDRVARTARALRWSRSSAAATIRARTSRSRSPRCRCSGAAVPGARLRIIGANAVTSGDGVESLGEVASVAEPLREASLLLLPSRQEGFGIVAAERSRAACPSCRRRAAAPRSCSAPPVAGA